jgi:transposase-like protein
MYSYEQRLRAVELYIQLGKRVGATIRQLGYPTKNALKGWYGDYQRQRGSPLRSRAPVGKMRVKAGAGRTVSFRQRKSRRLVSEEAHVAELLRCLAAQEPRLDAHRVKRRGRRTADDWRPMARRSNREYTQPARRS